MPNACEIDKQRVHVILHDVRNIKKAVDDMEAPSVGCVSHVSAGCTRGSAARVLRHRLTCQLKEGGQPMLE